MQRIEYTAKHIMQLKYKQQNNECELFNALSCILIMQKCIMQKKFVVCQTLKNST